MTRRVTALLAFTGLMFEGSIAAAQPPSTHPLLLRDDAVMSDRPWIPETTREVLAVVGARAPDPGIYLRVGTHDDSSSRRCSLTACVDASHETDAVARTAPGALRTTAAPTTDKGLLFVAGGASLAAAIVLWAIGAHNTDETVITPSISDGRFVLSVAGTW